MRKTRKVLAVALVATALCADRIAVASPQQAQEGTLTQVARRVVVRLSVSFRRVVPGVRIHQARQEGESAGWRVVAEPVKPLVHLVQGLPFQFRLPPPAMA